MMPSACDGVIAVTAIDQKDGSIDFNQGTPLWTNYLSLDPKATPMTDFKWNLTIAAPGMS
jgi:hypothetical protein